jgi:hypothetical protein
MISDQGENHAPFLSQELHEYAKHFGNTPDFIIVNVVAYAHNHTLGSPHANHELSSAGAQNERTGCRTEVI